MADYQGACSCLGINAVTKTLKTPKVTETTTYTNYKKTITLYYTATSSYTVTRTQTVAGTTTVAGGGAGSVETHTAFKLVSTKNTNVGQYVRIVNPGGLPSEIGWTNAANAGTFFFDKAGNWAYTSTGTAGLCTWNYSNDQQGSLSGVFFADPDNGVTADSLSPIKCSIDAALNFSCYCGGSISQWWSCGGNVLLMAPGTAQLPFWQGPGCVALNIAAVAA